MYKIDYKGFKIETDSVIEVEQLLGKAETKPAVTETKIPQVTAKKPVGRPKGTKSKSNRKSSKRGYTYSQWTVPEIEYITTNLERVGASGMAHTEELLRHHTKGAIRTMCWRVNSLPKHYKNGTNKEVQKVIEDYQKTKKTCVGFFGDRTKSLLD